MKPPLSTELTDVKKYNHATAKLMFAYGCVFIIEGVILFFKSMTCMVVGILTVMPGIVIVIAIYETFVIKNIR